MKREKCEMHGRMKRENIARDRGEFITIKMSYKYTMTTPSEMRSSKIPSIIVWKVAGCYAFEYPKI